MDALSPSEVIAQEFIGKQGSLEEPDVRPAFESKRVPSLKVNGPTDASV